MPLAKLLATGQGFHLEALANKVAICHSRLSMLSCAGPERTISGLSATLNGKSADATSAKLLFWEPGAHRPVEVAACPYGYTVHKAHLAFDSYQLLAVTKDPQFLPALTEPALLAKLRSERFTTPFLADWIPDIMAHLKTWCDGLSPCNCFGCESWMLHATTTELDAAVQWLVRSKRVAFPGAHTMEAVA